jgi:YtkA-like
MRRRSKYLLSLALGAAFVVLPGCGAAEDPGPTVDFPAAPLAVIASESGKLSIEVRTGPTQPPSRGRTDVQLLVRDLDGVNIDGLAIDATPWMPAMGHGTSVEPVPSSLGEGRYALHNVSMYMAGRWELRTTFAGAVTDTATPVFDVP